MIATGLLALAWLVALVTPSESAHEAPFPVAAANGDEGVGRNLAVRVDEVRKAESVLEDGWTAEGNWLVVDLEAAAVVEEFGVSLTLATFTVDGRTYRASERPRSFLQAGLFAGIPQTGSLAFELADDVVAGTGVLRFAVNADARLDSVIEVTVDLAELETEASVELRPAEWRSR
ncbi:hypothetical protein LG299_08760 [Microbacterium lacus]|uniref:hypothetical protein n=1 Tax=Microbacterium lacus TaxID=415217 RepID=UPI00384D1775